jgi:hypothetical protein
VNAEFNWWLLIVGLVVGAGLVWLVVLESRRREADIDDAERAREALWLSAVLADEGQVVSPEAAGRLLELHRRYLEAPPPDPVDAVAPTPPDAAVAAVAAVDPEPGPADHPVIEPEPSTATADEPSELADDDRLRVEGGRVDLGQ